VSVLAVAPTPADLFIGCAGTLARWKQGGREVFVALPGAPEPQLEAAQEAASTTGVQLLENDSSVERVVDERSVRDALMDHIRRAEAEVLLTVAAAGDEGGELPDVLFNAAYCATIPNYESPGGIGAIRVRAPIRYFESPPGRDFVPTEYVDVSEHWSTKRDAVASFGNEAVETAEILARARGIQSQVEFAEAFTSETVWGRIRSSRQLP